jgi:hypothetical protein
MTTKEETYGLTLNKIELIRSIFNSYSIGVLVLYINDNHQFEILDGQQRLLTIKKYLNGKLNLEKSGITPYDELDEQNKMFLNAYSVGYLKLKSHNPRNQRRRYYSNIFKVTRRLST